MIPESRYLRYFLNKNFNKTSKKNSLFLFTGSTFGLDVVINKRHLV